MKKTWVEVICDGCGSAEHFSPSFWRETAREYGWILTNDGKHYCCKRCKNKRNKII